MNYKIFFVLLFVLIPVKTFSQTTYFIKYKSSVPAAEVDQKVTEQKFSDVVRDQRVSLPDFEVDYLAKGLGRGDEVLGRIVKIQFSDDVDESSFNSMLASDSEIEYIQKSTTYKLNYTPNDSLISQQWALEKIKAFDAWDITQGSDTILLAIIDTGIEFFHPDLQNKIYYNPNEIPDNNIDDDNNGFIDDYMGWDFTDRVGFPFDTTGGDFLGWDNYPYDPVPGSFGFHGTFVGGIAGAEVNNSKGVAGIAPNIKLLNIRSFDNTGNGEEDDAAAAILYAVQMGAKVINMSWGDYSFSYVLRDVIRYAYSQNVIMVASSGNRRGGVSITALHYPSGYNEVISVGASTENDGRASFSIYGSTLDLLAPGTGIKSTDIELNYSDFNGTSAAAPHVSATAALILSLQNFSNEEVKQIIKSTCDDIGESGWDLQTGAGRLNLFRALSILAPAKVKINYPNQDFTTNNDTLNFNLTVMSPYFVRYSFQYGSGTNPEQWITLISEGRNQILNENAYSLDLSNLPEGAYTARLVLEMNNGSTTEERINFFVQRTPPDVELVGIGPVYIGGSTTLLSEVYTSQRAIVRLYYRVKGTTDFNFVTLDGFLINNQFVKQLHYGFVPKQIITQNTTYEVYLTAVNLAGLETEIRDEGGNYFEFSTDRYPSLISYNESTFNLPRGTIFGSPVNYLSGNNNEVLFNELIPNISDTIKQNFTLYQYSGNSLVKKDSVINKIPVQAGDFNNNGKIDLLSLFFPYSYIDEQAQEFTFDLETKFTTSYSNQNRFYPILVEDFNNDGTTEVLSNYFDTLSTVWKINNDLSVTRSDTLKNYSFIDSFDSLFLPGTNTINNAVVADLNGDGIREIWLADLDGDLISYKILGDGSYSKGDSLITRLFTNTKNTLSAGDFDGDGVEEIAVLFETNSIAPNFFLLVFNYKNNVLNILYEKVFLDQSAEFIGFGFKKIFQSLKFADIDNDGKSELILNIFPNVYIFKHNQTEVSLIFFQEGVNSENIFAGDLDQNGVTEIGFQTSGGIKFFEFAASNKAAPPFSVEGFSLDSTKINLSWQGTGDRFLIYKASDEDLILIDSTTAKTFVDTLVTNNITYYYAIKAYDASKLEPYSNLSEIINVYSHEPSKVISVANDSPKNLIVKFSERIRTTVENLRAFEIENFGFPNSISPANQYAYLLSFNDPLPVGLNNLFVKNINDFYGSPVSDHTFQFTVQQIVSYEEFFITSFEILNPYKIKLTFNFEVDQTSAAVKENYSFEPENHVASVEIDNSNRKIIYLNLDGKRPIGSVGREYRLRVNNLESSGGLTINSGAGSYVVLTSFAQDLSDVYVYPNPASGSNEKITFANLPKRAKIIIFNLSGDRINEIDETDGNGGADFNLNYSNGEKLSSGIYIYRIVMLDDSDNEVEEKIGKFAVMR